MFICFRIPENFYPVHMPINLSDLLKAAKGQKKERELYQNYSVLSLPNVVERAKRITAREIDPSPFKILDAPGLIDDYYLNLLDWEENRLAIALGESVYSYDVDTKSVSSIFKSEAGYISSIKGLGNMTFIGDSEGSLHAYDLIKEAVVSRTQVDQTRACSLAASDRLVTVGCKSGLISSIDLRSGKAMPLYGHTQEVCGLRWCNDYLASGANDNTIRIWRAGSPLSTMVLKGHNSAIKAMDWCPWRTNILATGGGTKDKTIRFWDTVTGNCLEKVEVESQVCTLSYLRKYKEIVTSHGYQENSIKLWKAAGMKNICTFGQHENRVLHTALSPDQCTMVSLGADESLKFWKIADKQKVSAKRDSIGMR